MINFDKVLDNLNKERKLLDDWQFKTVKRNADKNKELVPIEVILAVQDKIRELDNEIGKIQSYQLMSR